MTSQRHTRIATSVRTRPTTKPNGGWARSRGRSTGSRARSRPRAWSSAKLRPSERVWVAASSCATCSTTKSSTTRSSAQVKWTRAIDVSRSSRPWAARSRTAPSATPWKSISRPARLATESNASNAQTELIPPPAAGVRVDWFEVPEPVRLAFELWAGARAVSAHSQPSGFSPGVAARLRLADGQRIFVKAIGPETNPDSPEFHRREARIVSALPQSVPAPRLRWSLDDAATGWVVLAFDEVD